MCVAQGYCRACWNHAGVLYCPSLHISLFLPSFHQTLTPLFRRLEGCTSGRNTTSTASSTASRETFANTNRGMIEHPASAWRRKAQTRLWVIQVVLCTLRTSQA
ncbi:unnamed protein product [Prorocentrum cordatum]|uniref:Uncharacterized protein n=1 Tax=Prorocentrum cordatum TaxID=2364126 RepID=A0ABN9X643_9DINO|nr:unnamed protein product [Polarella glacialis]